jgi:hypothetical protein
MKTKKPRRYKLTERSGLTLKAYRPAKDHKKLPAVCYVYTPEELEEFAKLRGFEVSKNVK